MVRLALPGVGGRFFPYANAATSRCPQTPLLNRPLHPPFTSKRPNFEMLAKIKIFVAKYLSQECQDLSSTVYKKNCQPLQFDPFRIGVKNCPHIFGFGLLCRHTAIQSQQECIQVVHSNREACPVSAPDRIERHSRSGSGTRGGGNFFPNTNDETSRRSWGTHPPPFTFWPFSRCRSLLHVCTRQV